MSGNGNIIHDFEQAQIARIASEKEIPEFRAGDTVRAHVRIAEEGKTSRIQVFEGLCIARRNRGYNSAFTLRKISNGEGVERVFQVYSPLVEKIEVVRKGVVRRAKLYYMRERTGRAARIREKTDYNRKKKADTKSTAPAKPAKKDGTSE